jgi:hypothetical protein
LKNQLFRFVSLIKKISFLEPYLKRVGFEDKGQGFPKKLFYCSKSNLAAEATDIRKTVVLTLSPKRAQKKHLLKLFSESGSLQPGDYHAKKIN